MADSEVQTDRPWLLEFYFYFYGPPLFEALVSDLFTFAEGALCDVPEDVMASSEVPGLPWVVSSSA